MRRTSDVRKILRILAEMYPDAACSLDDDGDPFHMLIRAILSAQCTDKRVNETTATLFQEYPDAVAFASEAEEILAEKIKSCGLYHAKARAIVGTSGMLLREYGGSIPKDEKELVSLPGVGRKIANLILGEVYGIPAIVVDTHCARVAVRLGLSDKSMPAGIEKDLSACVPREQWIKLGHRLVAHGRNLCAARNPKCEMCPLREVCSYAKSARQQKNDGKTRHGG